MPWSHRCDTWAWRFSVESLPQRCRPIGAHLCRILGERVFHLDRAHVQTLMYLKLSVAGHLTIFLTRGPFWSVRAARILWAGVLGTQAVATLIEREVDHRS
jgi:hypothetical protein